MYHFNMLYNEITPGNTIWENPLETKHKILLVLSMHFITDTHAFISFQVSDNLNTHIHYFLGDTTTCLVHTRSWTVQIHNVVSNIQYVSTYILVGTNPIILGTSPIIAAKYP
jgi:hypothetical protein